MSIQGSPTRTTNDRVPAALNPSLDRKLLGYAAAASAAGVSILALAQTAPAEIVFTEMHKTILPNTSLAIDVNNDGITDLTIVNTVYSGSFTIHSHFWKQRLIAVAASGNRVVNRGHAQTNSASAMYAGSVVGPGKAFNYGSNLMDLCNAGPSTVSSMGRWGAATNRYLGLAFQIDGETHYGWARLTVYLTFSHCRAKAVLTGYAYESVAGRPIIAGKTSGTGKLSEAQPSAPTLGALALGSVTHDAWRREEDISN